MKITPFSFIYYFKNTNLIPQYYRYCFVGRDPDNKTSLILSSFEQNTQSEVEKTISESHQKHLESIYGSDFLQTLFPKKLDKKTKVLSGGDANFSAKSIIGDILRDVDKSKNSKKEKDIVLFPINNSMIPSNGSPSLNIFVYANPPSSDDNVEALQQKIYRYIRYGDNEFSVLEPQFVYMWSETKGIIRSISHQMYSKYDTELLENGIRPTTDTMPEWNKGKIGTNKDKLLENIINLNSDTIHITDFWHEKQGLNLNDKTTENYLRCLFPFISNLNITNDENLIKTTYDQSYIDNKLDLEYRDNIAILLNNEKETKSFGKIEKISSYKITQCIFKFEINNKINQQLFLDKLKLSKKIVFAKWTMPNKTYWGKVYIKFLDQLELVQKWKSQNNLLRSLVLKVNLRLGDNNYKFITISFRTMEDERTEVSIKMNFKEHMNTTLEQIYQEYLPYVISVLKELEKMCEFNIFEENIMNTLSLYNISTIICVPLPDRSQLYNRKKNKLLSKLSSVFIPYAEKPDDNNVLYIKTNEYNIKKEERIRTFIRANVTKYGATPSASIYKTISMVTKLPENEVLRIYSQISKELKQNHYDTVKHVEFKPNGIKIKNLYDFVTKTNTYHIMGITSYAEFNRLFEYIKIISSLYYRIFVLGETDVMKTLQGYNKNHQADTIDLIDEHNLDSSISQDTNIKRIKKLTETDPERNGYKPIKGMPGYSRLCQHQPDVVDEDDAKTYLEERGFRFNEDINGYEKQLENGEKTYAIGLISSKDNKTKYYFSDNPEYPHIGFTDQNKHPKKMVTACCFKKNQFLKTDPKKMQLLQKFSGLNIERINTDTTLVYNEALYVLQDKQLLPLGRVGVLEKHLDIVLNKMNENSKIVLTTDNRLEECTNYFVKQGVDINVQNINSNMINCLLLISGLSIKEFRTKVIEILKKNYLMILDGQLCLEMKLADFLAELESDVWWKNDKFILSCYSFFDHGYNIFHLKNSKYNKQNIKLGFVSTNNLDDPERDAVIIFSDKSTAKKYVYPVCVINKTMNSDKFELRNVFKTQELLGTLGTLYIQSFEHIRNSIGSNALSPRDIIRVLKKYNKTVRYQILNVCLRCSFLVTDTNLIIPTLQDFGCLYDYKHKLEPDELLDITEYLDILREYETSNPGILEELKLIPISYNFQNNTTITELFFESQLSIPLKPKVYSEKPKILFLGKRVLEPIERNFTDDNINREILTRNRIEPYIDRMISQTSTKTNLLINYQYFRFHWYKFFISKAGRKHSQYIQNILSTYNSKDAVKHLLLYMDKIYDELSVYETKLEPKPNLNLNIKFCPTIPTKDSCNQQQNCFWKNDRCKLLIDIQMKDHFIRNIVNELCIGGIHRDELLGLNLNSVSEFWGDNFKFEERKDELLFSSMTDANYNFEYFIKNYDIHSKTSALSTIKYSNDITSVKYADATQDIQYTQTHIVQKIHHDNLVLFRLLSNLYFASINSFLETRSILYNRSEAQTKNAIEIRGLIFKSLFKQTSEKELQKLIVFISSLYSEENKIFLTFENVEIIVRQFSCLNDYLRKSLVIIHEVQTKNEVEYYFQNGKQLSKYPSSSLGHILEFKIFKSNNNVINRFDAMYKF
jgi:disulfide oxidoreductase YuzD